MCPLGWQHTKRGRHTGRPVVWFTIRFTRATFSLSLSAGMCQPRVPGTVGAEPFSAKIRYTGPDDPDFPNLIKLTVNMPHMDGKFRSSLTPLPLTVLTRRIKNCKTNVFTFGRPADSLAQSQ